LTETFGEVVSARRISAPLSYIFAWKNAGAIDSIARMFTLLFVLLSLAGAMPSNDLPTKKYLDLAAIKTMVAAAEAEAKKRNVDVTICIVDDSGNLLFLQKGDTASINTIEFAQKKARHAALYKSASKDGADAVKKGSVEALAFPNFFPNQGGLPIIADGRILGGIAASGAKSEIDEAVAQAAIDALFKK
jgi:glc operon protein GlcG